MTKIRQYTIALIITAAVIVEVMAATQYFMTQHVLERELLAKAQRDMQESQRVATVKARVESAVENELHNVRDLINTPEEFQRLAANLVKTNADIVGAGIAFPADFYKNSGHEGLFAPYAYDTNPPLSPAEKEKHRPNIKSTQLSFDYTNREWFQTPLLKGARLWTQPYLDQGGTRILMCSYAVPVAIDGRTVGVFFADVPLADVSILSQDMYSSIHSNRMIIFGIQLFSFLLMCFIVWRAVAASRRYKVQYVDPEKEHVIEQMAKLREVNARLTKRNQALAEKVAQLQTRLQSQSQQSDPNWFG